MDEVRKNSDQRKLRHLQNYGKRPERLYANETLNDILQIEANRETKQLS